MTEKRGPGRPSKLNDKTRDTLIKCLRIGMTRKAACGASGIVYDTFRRWIEKGEVAKSGEYFVLSVAVVEAEAEGLARMEKVWIEAATGAKAEYDEKGNEVKAEVRPFWKAAKEYLARRHRPEWGEKIDVSLSDLNITIKGDLSADDINSPVEKEPEKKEVKRGRAEVDRKSN